MRLFFCAIKREGVLDDGDVEVIRSRILESVVIRDHVTQCEVRRPSRQALVVGVSNEPAGAATVGDRVVWTCGVFWATGSFAAIEPDLGFADAVSRLPGRFSALMVKGSRLAIGTPVARVDSVFHAENDGFVFFGNQASVLSTLRDGRVRHAPRNLVSFISGGYFGSDRTPYEGVTVLPPLTTIVHDGERLHRGEIQLAELKGDGRSREEILEASADALAAAMRPVADAGEPVQIGLTGGKDSRLLLAALLHAGVQPSCSTNSKGAANRADVWVARTLAELVGVPHTVVDVSRRSVEAPSASRIDLLAQTAATLRISDGMLGALTPLGGDPAVHRPRLSVWGQGGECLRGGWTEHMARPNAGSVAEVMRRAFERYSVYAGAALEDQHAYADGWIARQLERCAPPDVLDIGYLYFRIGRWVGAGSRGSSSKLLPLLDNRFSREVLAMDARAKRSHYLHRALIGRLLPAVQDLPLANKFWNGTKAEERERLRAAYPEAYSEEKEIAARKAERSRGRRLRDLFSRRRVTGLAPPVVAHIRDYLVREGRLDLMADVLDADRTVRFLRSPDPALQPKHFLLGAYSAAVLLSEDWAGRRIPSRPIAIRRSAG